MLSVLDRLAGAHEAAGDLPGAIRARRAGSTWIPLDEAGTSGSWTSSRRTATGPPRCASTGSCVAILDRELGVVPLASTTARYEAIRDADTGRWHARPRPVPCPASADAPARPSPPTPLVGRGDALTRLLAAHRRSVPRTRPGRRASR